MFGYVTINQDELKVREVREYRSWYCGLCHSLYERHGRRGQMTLTYDMTFLAMLLNGLYEDKVIEKDRRCLTHPVHRHHMTYSHVSGYAADMNVILAYYNMLDDWRDDRQRMRYAAARVLSGRCRAIKRRWPRQYRAVSRYIKDLEKCEKSGTDNIDEAACLTGKMLAEIFVREEDEWSSDLRQMGFYLGKFIYLMDAYEDLEKDTDSGNYNPLITIKDNENFDDECKDILMMQMAECCRAFERLPVIEHAEILRNILYSGVWTRFWMVYNKRNKAGDNK